MCQLHYQGITEASEVIPLSKTSPKNHNTTHKQTKKHPTKTLFIWWSILSDKGQLFAFFSSDGTQLRLTYECEGVLVTVPSKEVAAVSSKTIQGTIKSFDVLIPKKAATGS